MKFFSRCTTNNGVYFFIALLLYLLYLLCRIFLGNLLAVLAAMLFCCNRKKRRQEVKNQTVHFCYRVQDQYIADELQVYNRQREEGSFNPHSIFTKLQEVRFKFYRKQAMGGFERQPGGFEGLPFGAGRQRRHLQSPAHGGEYLRAPVCLPFHSFEKALPAAVRRRS